MPSTRLNVTEQPLVIDLGLYNCTVELYLTQYGLVAGVEAAGCVMEDIPEGSCGGLCLNLLAGHRKVLVALLDSDPGTLAHELYHATWMILDYTGVKVDGQNDEAGAYLIGYLYSKAAEHVSKAAPPVVGV